MVVVTSFWEDISHRLDTVNIILYITHRLVNHMILCYPQSYLLPCLKQFTVSIILCCFFLQQSNLETFKTAISAKVSDNKLVEVWLKLLTQLIEDLER